MIEPLHITSDRSYDLNLPDGFYSYFYGDDTQSMSRIIYKVDGVTTWSIWFDLPAFDRRSQYAIADVMNLHSVLEPQFLEYVMEKTPEVMTWLLFNIYDIRDSTIVDRFRSC